MNVFVAIVDFQIFAVFGTAVRHQNPSELDAYMARDAELNGPTTYTVVELPEDHPCLSDGSIGCYNG